MPSAMDWVDPDRLVVTGGSYAGYMTAWLITQDHRFKAAVAQRGVYEISVFFGESNAYRLVPTHYGGYPWDEEVRTYLDANSPLTHVENIQTPLLIIHADRDLARRLDSIGDALPESKDPQKTGGICSLPSGRP